VAEKRVRWLIERWIQEEKKKDVLLTAKDGWLQKQTICYKLTEMMASSVESLIIFFILQKYSRLETF
jgi:hypothetical protein